MTATESLTPTSNTATNTATQPLKHKHLLDLQDWTKKELLQFFETTDAMADVMKRTIKKVPALQGKTIATLFFENSTRTKLSFERAARAQSADVVSFAAGSSSLTKGESIKDTILTINAMQVDAYVVRHVSSGVPYQLTRWTDASIINAGDGRRAHPTQALLDAYTFRQAFNNFTDSNGFEGKKIAIVGDILHSRVARSNIKIWTTLGAEVALCGPRMLLPDELEQENVTLTNSVNEAVEGAHAVMALRMQQERMTGGLLPSLQEYSERYQVNDEVIKLAHDDCIIMHPGPMNREVEISSELADGERSVIEKQVANGVPVRMAVFYSLLVGKG